MIKFDPPSSPFVFVRFYRDNPNDAQPTPIPAQCFDEIKADLADDLEKRWSEGSQRKGGETIKPPYTADIIDEAGAIRYLIQYRFDRIHKIIDLDEAQ